MDIGDNKLAYGFQGIYHDIMAPNVRSFVWILRILIIRNCNLPPDTFFNNILMTGIEKERAVKRNVINVRTSKSYENRKAALKWSPRQSCVFDIRLLILSKFAVNSVQIFLSNL